MYMRQTKEIRINEFLLGGMKQFIIKLPMHLGLIYYDNASKCLLSRAVEIPLFLNQSRPLASFIKGGNQGWKIDATWPFP